jgi:hypothetical protein
MPLFLIFSPIHQNSNLKIVTLYCRILYNNGVIYFRRNQALTYEQICALLGSYAASCGNCLPKFRDNVSVPSSRVKIPFPLGLLTREDGTDTLSRNVGKQLPHDAAWYPTRAQITSTSLRKPEIKHMNILCCDVVSIHQPRQTGIPTLCTGDEEGTQGCILMAAPTVGVGGGGDHPSSFQPPTGTHTQCDMGQIWRCVFEK